MNDKTELPDAAEALDVELDLATRENIGTVMENPATAAPQKGLPQGEAPASIGTPHLDRTGGDAPGVSEGSASADEASGKTSSAVQNLASRLLKEQDKQKSSGVSASTATAPPQEQEASTQTQGAAPPGVVAIPGSGGSRHQRMGLIESDGDECPIRRSIAGLDDNLFILAIPASYFTQSGTAALGDGPPGSMGKIQGQTSAAGTPGASPTQGVPTSNLASTDRAVSGTRSALGAVFSPVARVAKGVVKPPFLAGLAVGGAVVVGSNVMNPGQMDGGALPGGGKTVTEQPATTGAATPSSGSFSVNDLVSRLTGGILKKEP